MITIVNNTHLVNDGYTHSRVTNIRLRFPVEVTFIEGADQTIRADGQELEIHNVGNSIIAHQSATSADVNRVITGTGASATVAPGGVVRLRYDEAKTSPVSRWRL